MKKKIVKLCLIFIITCLVSLFTLNLTAHSKANTSDVGIVDSDKNEKGEYIPGLFLSIGRILQTEDDCNDFIKEFYHVNSLYEIQSHFANFYNTFCTIENGYVTSFKVIFIQNKVSYNKWLADIGKNTEDFTSDISLFILFLNTYKGYYLLDLKIIPDYFYSFNSGKISFSTYICPIVVDGAFSYIDNSIFNCPSEVCQFNELENCIGKFEQVSADVYKYVYVSYKFDSIIGYYIDPNSFTKELQLHKKDLPSIAIGDDGNLLTCYIAVKDKHFLRPIVKENHSEISSSYYINKEFYYTSFGPHDSGEDFYFFVAYLNFDIPVDAILNINLSYGYYKKSVFRKKFYNATCTISCDTKIKGNLPDSAISIAYPSGYELAIQKGEYLIKTKEKGNMIFDFRIVLSDDNYKPFSFALEDAYCSYPENYWPTNTFEIYTMQYMYDSIIFDADNITSIPIQEIIYPSKFDRFLDKVDYFFSNFGQIIKRILLVLFVIIAMFFVIKIFIYSSKKKKQA